MSRERKPSSLFGLVSCDWEYLSLWFCCNVMPCTLYSFFILLELWTFLPSKILTSLYIRKVSTTRFCCNKSGGRLKLWNSDMKYWIWMDLTATTPWFPVQRSKTKQYAVKSLHFTKSNFRYWPRARRISHGRYFCSKLTPRPRVFIPQSQWPLRRKALL